MRTNHNSISVIIPVYNGESFLADAVESIQRQNYEQLEIVIVDDGSTDSTSKIAACFVNNVRYVYQSNSGPSVARNRGLRLAHGNFIAFLDADDLWSENKLQLQLDHFTRVPSLAIVLGHTKRMQLTGTENGTLKFKERFEPILAMHLGSAMFKKSVFDKVGYLDESLHHCEDWDWFMKAKEMKIPILVHKEVTYFYRRHDQNMTNDMKTGFNFALKMLKQSLDRRRQQGNGQVKQLP